YAGCLLIWIRMVMEYYPLTTFIPYVTTNANAVCGRSYRHAEVLVVTSRVLHGARASAAPPDRAPR
ncbi:hypothetical protein NL445_27565, partial [Klebsiella pneumoniae]|nr:hypothetical protein [Klebsiella pneumoniae]